jgi:uncharacterized protein YbjT (DUF2867 family)
VVLARSVGVDLASGDGLADALVGVDAVVDVLNTPTIVRATQFFDHAAMVVRWTRRGQVATVPPLLVQPVAVADVADVLVQVAAGTHRNGVAELAGPNPRT